MIVDEPLTQPNEPKQDKPVFDRGLIISSPSIVIDKNGLAWHINPDTAQIKRAEIG